MSSDPVNSPEHYASGEVECIDAMISALTPEEFRGYCLGNAIKYIWRSGLKGKRAEDLAKAVWYTRIANGDDPRRDDAPTIREADTLPPPPPAARPAPRRPVPPPRWFEGDWVGGPPKLPCRKCGHVTQHALRPPNSLYACDACGLKYSQPEPMACDICGVPYIGPHPTPGFRLGCSVTGCQGVIGVVT